MSFSDSNVFLLQGSTSHFSSNAITNSCILPSLLIGVRSSVYNVTSKAPSTMAWFFDRYSRFTYTRTLSNTSPPRTVSSITENFGQQKAMEATRAQPLFTARKTEQAINQPSPTHVTASTPKHPLSSDGAARRDQSPSVTSRHSLSHHFWKGHRSRS